MDRHIHGMRPAELSSAYSWMHGAGRFGSTRLSDQIDSYLVGGFNPFEKYYIVKLDHLPK